MNDYEYDYMDWDIDDQSGIDQDTQALMQWCESDDETTWAWGAYDHAL